MALPTMRVYSVERSGEHEIWLDAGMDLQISFCIGVGSTKDEAVDDAVGELRAALRQLGAPITDIRDLE